MVDLAAKVRDYAGNAGGDLETSYYKNILDWVKEYCTTDDASRKEELKGNITTLVNDQLKAIDNLSKDIKSTKETLKTFDTTSQEQSNALSNHKKTIATLLDGNKGRIATLRAQIKTDQDQLQKDKDEYDHGMVPSMYNNKPV